MIYYKKHLDYFQLDPSFLKNLLPNLEVGFIGKLLSYFLLFQISKDKPKDIFQKLNEIEQLLLYVAKKEDSKMFGKRTRPILFIDEIDVLDALLNTEEGKVALKILFSWLVKISKNQLCHVVMTSFILFVLDWVCSKSELVTT